ncbi:hypothetical protein [Actinomadura sp. 6K520]|uniref:hypothetical protein n=1 Tax=Actinomadura sp. 6K520 TaxID=2530364 RepID=UPI00104D4F2C|nr:hypothetical protein [Actinomadura sp. 6K520]TDE28566.1 hypothetical protein E1289_21540 [Actinomadura sp. 6K520]
MARFEHLVEELLDFLMMRLDERDLERLVVHEPQRISAAYMFTEDGRCEVRVDRFTGCSACSQVPPEALFASPLHIDVEAWPCSPIRSLALAFFDDPDFRYWWRPEYAVFASGRLVHPVGEIEWPWGLVQG